MLHMIEERKQAMRAQRQRPRGGRHEAAIEEIAHRQGMTVAALKKRLQRYKRRQKKLGDSEKNLSLTRTSRGA